MTSLPSSADRSRVDAHADDHETWGLALLPGERLLWSGRPSIGAFARDFLRVRWIVLYLAVFLVSNAYQDRASGLGVVATLRGALPLLFLGGLLVGGLMATAWAASRTSRYVVTDRRCVMNIGIALTGSLSLPWTRLAQISTAIRSDGSGDIALTPGRPNTLNFFTLWPHARAGRFARPQPTLRCVRDAARVASIMQAAARDSSPVAAANVPSSGTDDAARTVGAGIPAR